MDICCNKSAHTKKVPMINFKSQTREVEGSVDGSRINSMNEGSKLMSYFYPEVCTLYDGFLKGKEVSKNGECYGWKPSKDTPFQWLRYSDIASLSQQVGSAFVNFGLSSSSYIGVFAKNRVEWVVTEQACNAYSLVLVPLYDTLGDEAIQFILQQTQMKIVVCENSPKALNLMKNEQSNLEYIIVIEDLTSEATEKAEEKNIKILTFEDLKKIGTDNLIRPIPPKPTDLATICYTSGTTGMPKGALLTHLNLISSSSSVIMYLKKSGIAHDNQQSYLSYLPLAHMLERIAQTTLLMIGGKIGFFQGDIKLFLNDLKELGPTILCTVPRIVNRIYSTVNDNVSKASGFKQRIFKWAYDKKEKEVLSGITRRGSIYDFPFKAVQGALGGNCQIILTGSAPISTEVLHFMRVVTGCYVLEGFGATETAGASSMQLPGETTVGNVGPPLLCCKYKLIDVPEMNLVVSRDNKGELCIAGSNIFQGYLNDPEKTNSVLKNGWYHTGDIGIFESNGTLKIVDRVKNIFKLQQGEYIAPEKIENIYVRSKYVAQVFVYGDSLKNNLIGIVVPEEPIIKEWAEEKSLSADMTALCSNEELKNLILKDINDIGKSEGLKSFEQVKALHLHNELFTLENGLLTPTMKSKRNELKNYFLDQINQMYSILD